MINIREHLKAVGIWWLLSFIVMAAPTLLILLLFRNLRILAAIAAEIPISLIITLIGYALLLHFATNSPDMVLVKRSIRELRKNGRADEKTINALKELYEKSDDPKQKAHCCGVLGDCMLAGEITKPRRSIFA